MHTQSLFAIVVSLLLAGAGAWTSTPAAGATTPGEPGSTVANIVVNTFEDELNVDGHCSLREAIQAANTDQQIDACAAGQGADTIGLPAGTYTLTLPGADENGNATGDLDILSDLTLRGVWSAVTIIDGNQLDRVLHVHAGAEVEVSGVTIRNGMTPRGLDNPSGGADGGDGGGIWNEGNLALLDCSVVNNRTGDGGSGYVDDPWVSAGGGRGGRGGGIASSGALTLTLGVVASNVTGDGGEGGSGSTAGCCRGGEGGGIFNLGQLVVTASTVRDNRAGAGSDVVSPPAIAGKDGGDGGGIANQGHVMIVASTVSGNAAGSGGISGTHGSGGAGGDGGAISNQGSTAELTLLNSTISGNQAGDGGDSLLGPGPGGDGGGIYNDALLTAGNTTVTGNLTGDGGWGLSGPGEPGSGGGISNQNSAEVRNTILAGNTAGGTESDCQGALTSKGYNFLQSLAGCVLTGDATGNITGQEPRLGPLANNGGPTWTHALLPGSPAVDAGSCIGLDDSPVTVDQRGAPRPQGRGCDMGAYEAAARIYLPVVQK